MAADFVLSNDLLVNIFRCAPHQCNQTGTTGPFWAVREFDVKVLRVRYPKKARTGPSEQAIRAAIRQCMLNLKLRIEQANKGEIRILKEQGVLGKRAPSCTLLNSFDTVKLLKAFGRKRVAVRFIAAVGGAYPHLREMLDVEWRTPIPAHHRAVLEADFGSSDDGGASDGGGDGGGGSAARRHTAAPHRHARLQVAGGASDSDDDEADVMAETDWTKKARALACRRRMMRAGRSSGGMRTTSLGPISPASSVPSTPPMASPSPSPIPSPSPSPALSDADNSGDELDSDASMSGSSSSASEEEEAAVASENENEFWSSMAVPHFRAKHPSLIPKYRPLDRSKLVVVDGPANEAARAFEARVQAARDDVADTWAKAARAEEERMHEAILAQQQMVLAHAQAAQAQVAAHQQQQQLAAPLPALPAHLQQQQQSLSYQVALLQQQQRQQAFQLQQVQAQQAAFPMHPTLHHSLMQQQQAFLQQPPTLVFATAAAPPAALAMPPTPTAVSSAEPLAVSPERASHPSSTTSSPSRRRHARAHSNFDALFSVARGDGGEDDLLAVEAEAADAACEEMVDETDSASVAIATPPIVPSPAARTRPLRATQRRALDPDEDATLDDQAGDEEYVEETAPKKKSRKQRSAAAAAAAPMEQTVPQPPAVAPVAISTAPGVAEKRSHKKRVLSSTSAAAPMPAPLALAPAVAASAPAPSLVAAGVDDALARVKKAKLSHTTEAVVAAASFSPAGAPLQPPPQPQIMQHTMTAMLPPVMQMPNTIAAHASVAAAAAHASAAAAHQHAALQFTSAPFMMPPGSMGHAQPHLGGSFTSGVAQPSMTMRFGQPGDFAVPALPVTQALVVQTKPLQGANAGGLASPSLSSVSLSLSFTAGLPKPVSLPMITAAALEAGLASGLTTPTPTQVDPSAAHSASLSPASANGSAASTGSGDSRADGRSPMPPLVSRSPSPPSMGSLSTTTSAFPSPSPQQRDLHHHAHLTHGQPMMVESTAATPIASPAASPTSLYGDACYDFPASSPPPMAESSTGPAGIMVHSFEPMSMGGHSHNGNNGGEFDPSMASLPSFMKSLAPSSQLYTPIVSPKLDAQQQQLNLQHQHQLLHAQLQQHQLHLRELQAAELQMDQL